LDTRNQAHAAVVNGLAARVDWFRELRQDAGNMNFFSRWRSSSNRAVAFATEFDYFIEFSKLTGKKDSQLVGLLTPLAPGSTPMAFPGWALLASTAKHQLKAAGFDVSRLGLADIPDVALAA
jgi:hypothetical protein